MSFMYVNTQPSESVENTLCVSHVKYDYTFLGQKVTVFSHENSVIPIYVNSKTNNVLIISGWFLLDDEINNLRKLSDLIESLGITSAIARIEAGVFSGCFVDSYNSKIQFFQDPTALLSHYYTLDKTKKISAEPATLINNIDKEMERFLILQEHLFSDKTIDANVKRMLPFQVLTVKDDAFKSDFCPRNIINYSFQSAQESTLRIDNHKPFLNNELGKVCALSSGFDSRLIAYLYNPSRTYTWGPEKSQDQLIGKKISNILKLPHDSFTYLSPKILDSDIEVTRLLFYGATKTPMTQLIANYRFSRKNYNDEEYALDGYLGDVLQRGSYVNFKGYFGELLKLSPSLYSLMNMSGVDIISKRYKNLDSCLLKILINDYEEKTDKINASEQAKVTFYEIFYGRGARRISSGGIVMNSLYYKVFAPFLSKTYLNYFLNKKFKDIVNYKVFKSLWFELSKKTNEGKNLYALKSEGGYSPRTPRVYIPIINLIGRINTHVNPTKKNYTRE